MRIKLPIPFVILFACPLACGGVIGPKSCVGPSGNIGYAPYIPPNSDKVTCLPAAAAVFMMCVRELSIETVSDSRTGGTNVTLPEVKASAASTTGGGVAVTSHNEYTIHFDDKLTEARVSAINQCIRVSEGVREASVTPETSPVPAVSVVATPAVK